MSTKLSLLLATLFILFLFSPTKVYAATFNIDATDDTSDSNPGDGICNEGSGFCTLRAAIEEANALSGSDTVNLPAENYSLGTQIQITSNITVVGSGTSDAIIDGGSSTNLFLINSGVTFSLSGATLRFTSGTSGGAISLTHSDATVNLTDVNVSSNSALRGGAIYQNGGTMTLTRVRAFHNNATSGIGGAIYCQSGTMQIDSTAVYTNESSAGGGGIGSGCTLTITNTTIYDNTAGGVGGAISNSGTLFLYNSTIFSNQGASDASGVYITGDFRGRNNIISSPQSGLNCVNAGVGTVLSLGGNVLSDNSCSSDIFTQSTDLMSTDPLLGEFADHGGSVQTVELKRNSPAVDAGVDSGCPVTDARGIARPHGPHCDSGAFELQYYIPPTPSVTPPPVPGCTATAPIGVPNLFQIDPAGTYVDLYFTTVKENTDSYQIFYGTNKNADQYAVRVNNSNNLWVLGQLISHLSPNTDYYFKVRAVNNCSAGQFSQIVSVKTLGRFANVSRFFANLVKKPPVPAIATITQDLKDSCTYTVLSGDSLWSIARAKWGIGTKYIDMLGLNKNLSENTFLRIGQSIKLCE